jgi:hypothetical protein
MYITGGIAAPKLVLQDGAQIAFSPIAKDLWRRSGTTLAPSALTRALPYTNQPRSRAS